MKLPQTLLLFLVCSSASSECVGQNVTPGNEESEGRIHVYHSSEEKHESLEPKPVVAFHPKRADALTITVDDSVKYQEIEGFGASLSESSAWLWKRNLSDSQRKEALQMLFDRKKGIGLSMLRQPMGASDFALQAYSYDDLPAGETDPDLKKFSLDHDRADILPVLKEVLAINPGIKIIGSPRSAHAGVQG